MATIPVTAAVVLAALFYWRGWFRLQKTNAIPGWRATANSFGLLCLWLAAGSPLMDLDRELLTFHMVQHLLLMTIGPPFILLGCPGLVICGDSMLRSAALQKIAAILARPVFCWLVAAAVLIGWHIPAALELGLRSELWHAVEQASFLAAGLLFWRPVIPSRPGAPPPGWSIVLYLFLATLPCDALSAFLAFCGRVVYPSYLSAPRHFSLSPLQDQECAGALMWTVATFAYLIPAVLATARLLAFPSGEAKLGRTCL